MTALPVLTYHSLDDSGSVVSVAPALFRRQVAGLAAAGWRTITFGDAVARLRSGDALPERHVVLTFDDAYRNVYTDAFPALQAHGFTATVFAISGVMGGHNDWPGHAPPMGRLDIMSWGEAAEMHRHGVEIAAHTASHPDLTALSGPAVEEEMRRSQEAIEDRVGAAVTTFAYPYGAVGPEAAARARLRFRGACTTRMGRVRAGDDPHLLPRIDAFYFRRAALFRSVPEPLLDPYLWGRQRLRDLRAAWT